MLPPAPEFGSASAALVGIAVGGFCGASAPLPEEAASAPAPPFGRLNGFDPGEEDLPRAGVSGSERLGLMLGAVGFILWAEGNMLGMAAGASSGMLGLILAIGALAGACSGMLGFMLAIGDSVAGASSGMLGFSMLAIGFMLAAGGMPRAAPPSSPRPN